MLEYITAAVLWSMIGFCVGVLASSSIAPDPRQPLKEKNSVTTPARIHRRNVIFGWVLIILALGTISQSLFLANRQADIIKCQSQYNAQFSQAIIERTHAGNTDRENLYGFISSVQRLTIDAQGLDPNNAQDREAIGALQAEYRQIISDFIETKDATDQTRAENPLPDYPPDCGPKAE